jgi:hypothetical protein
VDDVKNEKTKGKFISDIVRRKGDHVILKQFMLETAKV